MMKIPPRWLICSLLTGSLGAPSWGGAVYKCITNGTVTYSGTPAKGCSKIITDNSSVSIINPEIPSYLPQNNTIPEPELTNASSVPKEEYAVSSEAQKAYKDALNALDEGKKIRLGNERNYAKYLERIKTLEDNVEKAKEAMTREPAGY